MEGCFRQSLYNRSEWESQTNSFLQQIPYTLQIRLLGSSRELLDVFGKAEGLSSSGGGTGSSAGGGGGRRCVSVNDIRRAFEKAEQSLAISSHGKGQSCVGNGNYGPGISPSHNRMSSLDSTTSDESSIPTPHNYYGSVSSLISGRENLKDHYGSISSLASSTSLISPQVKCHC